MLTDRYTQRRMARYALWVLTGLWAMFAVLLFSACAPLAQPRSVAEGLAYAEGQVQAAVKSCAQATSARVLTIAQAVQCDTLTRRAFVAIDLGRASAIAGDATNAQAQLAAAQQLLRELEPLTKGSAR